MELCNFNTDVLNQKINNPYFPQIIEIIERSKFLLSKRTNKEILAAAEFINLMLDYYFNLEQTRGVELSDDEYEVQIKTRDNISEINALKYSINNSDLNNPEFLNGKDFEYFAVLAIWLITDALNWLYLSEGESKYPTRYWSGKFGIDGNVDSSQKLGVLRLSSTMTIEAMHAICFAENLATADALADEKTTQKLSERGSQGAHKKYAKFLPLIAFVEKLYDEGNWKSTRAAAKLIYPKLLDHATENNLYKLSGPGGEIRVYEWLLSHTKDSTPHKEKLDFYI